MKPFSQFVVETKPLKNPKYMTVSQINKEIDSLEKQSSAITDKFIEAGRGHEKPSEYLKKDDPLSKEAKRISDRLYDLRSEIEIRTGTRSHKFPHDFKPKGPRTY